MSTPDTPSEARKDGRWKKGQSGNPGGRSSQAAKLRAKLATGSDAVAKIVLAKAKEGDMQACRLVLERVVPALKPANEPARFELDDKDLPSTARSIMRAIADGVLSSDQGKALIDAVASMARVIEVAELEQELAELRALLESRS